MQNTTKIILGIDPGTIVLGYGVIAVKGKDVSLIDMGILKLAAKADAYEKLEKIHSSIAQMIRKFKPTDFAIEAPFFGKNVQSMLKLGRAQGVAIAAAMQAGLSVTEYSPKKVKQSITGNGNADKLQVHKMLESILKFEVELKAYDATDALAVALCHHYQESNVLFGDMKGKKDWKAFIANNPSRVKAK